MPGKPSKHIIQAITLGFIAGSRTSMAPAVTSKLFNEHKLFFRRRKGILKWLGKDAVTNFLIASAIPELIIDKLPFVGDRTELPGLVGRGISGALCGAAVYKDKNKNVAEGLLVGATAAVASTFALFYLRKAVSKNTKLPDIVCGVLEDALIVAAGAALVRKG